VTATDAGAAPDRALLDGLAASPNALAPHYSRFRVAERLLLTGHSHQAWPDVAREGLVAAFDDAAEAVDDKWDLAFARAEQVRRALRGWFGEPGAEIALAESTHELLVRLLSGLDLAGARPRLVASDGEFHSLRRQLDRLDEAGVEVMRVPTDPVDSLAERMAAAVDDRTAAALLSTVLFGSARIVPHLAALAGACRRHGAEVVLDAYHALGVMALPVRELGVADAWVVGGGYKYLQFGEGNAYMRLPTHAERIRPVVTGWFAEFGELTEGERPRRVEYAPGGQRFAGATYDPSSNYRAARVAQFFGDQRLTPAVVQASYRHQRAVLAAAFDALDLPDDVVTRDRETPPEAFGGFLALRSPWAGRLREMLRARGVMTDSRGEVLRLGPAPYLSDAQLEAGVAALGEAVRQLTR
jgi:selenocysteine lyase/cysteine desulfurase